MNFSKKYIITGPPGTGKTSLIQYLEKEGYPVSAEVSRDIIQLEQKINGNGFPWENVERYADLVFKETQKRLHQNANAVFSDRGMADVLVYLEFYGGIPSKELLNFDYHKFYHKTVFFTPFWKEIYKTDLQRPQGFDELKGLDLKIKETYHKLGFTCVELPLLSLKERANFILKYITNSKN